MSAAKPYAPDPARYEKMPYRRSGHSGIVLPPIALGIWQNFGVASDSDQVRDLVLHAFDRGIFHFDAANNYGPPPGAAEEWFGQILATDFAPYRDELIISTKAGYRMWPGPFGEWGSRKYLLASLDQSLKRLKLDYVDIFYSHRFDPHTPLEETMGALAHAVRSGKALYAGISNYDASQTREACAILKDMGIPCLINQSRLNLLDDAHIDLPPACERLGVGFMAFSPLAQGLLSERYLSGIPKNSRVGQNHDPALHDRLMARLPKIKALADIARERGEPLAHMALAWLLAQKGMTCLVTGARVTSQLDDQLAALQSPPFTETQLQRIDNIRLGSGPQPDRSVIA